MKKSVLLGLVLGLSSHMANALSISMNSETTITSERAVYVAKGNATSMEYIDVEEMRITGTQKMQAKMNGRLMQNLNAPIDAELVPGKTEGLSGHQRAKIEISGTKVLLLTDLRHQTTKKPSEEGKAPEISTVEKKTSYELEFVSGNISDLREGRSVEMRYTKDSIKKILDDTTTSARASAKVSGTGGGGVSISVKPLNSKHKGRIVIERNKITVEDIPTQIKISMSARG